MKKLFATLFAVFVLALHSSPVAWGANSATLSDTLPARVCGVGPVYEYAIAIDTTATDLDIRTPAGSRRLWVVGAWFSDNTAATLTFKSINSTPTTTKSRTFEQAANQGVYDEVGGTGFVFVTGANEKLTMQSSAALTSMTLYVVESATFPCGNN